MIRRKSIATEIQEHLDHVTAILVFANGTVPRGSGSLHSALSTLPTIFPNTWAKNIAFTFTNVANPLSWNFCQDAIPEDLKAAPQFQIDNPVALQGKYLRLKGAPDMKNTRTGMHAAVKDGELSGLETLVGLFDWLDGLEGHPTTEVVPLYEKSHDIKPKTTKLLTPMDQVVATKATSRGALSALVPIWRVTTRIWGRN